MMGTEAFCDHERLCCTAGGHPSGVTASQESRDVLHVAHGTSTCQQKTVAIQESSLTLEDIHTTVEEQRKSSQKGLPGVVGA